MIRGNKFKKIILLNFIFQILNYYNFFENKNLFLFY